MLNSKFWQAFFAIAPLAMLVITLIGYAFFIFSVVTNMPEIEQSGSDPAFFVLGNIGVFMLLVLLTVLISLGSLIFYIIHAVQNQNLADSSLLVVWILLFVFVSGIGQLIYWIVEILGKNRDNPVSERTS
ncbi:hypothetical protein [Poritiphilus flavus]|uniref:Cardiolipin synthase N-terminal domain-containing protein n=1 Tax=Poritiphilus flavus TaxID=2697053 RepID=A0A6L9EAL7_9FLAO|nr:hypothetical protein [Poritiphilus flavus]NAS11591.1 hypothetical protein [Poritiphilus flavus]